MSVQNLRHPHTYTLQLFQLAIDKLPPNFNPERRDYYSGRLAEFLRDSSVPYEEIRLTITQLGRESWSERQAYRDMYRRYGRSSEESFLLNNLDEGVRAKFEKFIDDGGKINYLRGMRSVAQLTEPTPFEQYFSPEEKFAVAQALLEAHDQARKEIENLLTDSKSDEYRELIKHYGQKEKIIDQKINELGKMAKLSDKWRETIIDRVRVIEEGWSVMEQGIDEPSLDQEIEYWRGTLASFLEA
ncbi:MAG: hypothetical protein V1738_06380 [Patescibacteria group bacterium]